MPRITDEDPAELNPEEDQRPHPSGEVIQQSQLQQAPNSAPTPTTEVDAYASGVAAQPQTVVESSPETSDAIIPPPRVAPPVMRSPANPQVQAVANDSDAYNSAQVATPQIWHHRLVDPRAEAQQRANDTAEAQQQQLQAQKDEEKRAASVARGLKSQGVDLETDPETGAVAPKRDTAGNVLYKPGTIQPPTQTADGRWIKTQRDRLGNEVEVEIPPRIDPVTGEKYIEDGGIRQSLGVDKSFLLRKDTVLTGQQLAIARQQAAALAAQAKDAKKKIADLLDQAAMVNLDKGLSDTDRRVKLDAIRAQRDALVKASAPLTQQHDAATAQMQQLQGDYSAKKQAMIEQARESLGLASLAPPAPPPGAPPVDPKSPEGRQQWTQQQVAAAKAGQKPYTIDATNHIQFAEDKPLESLTQAVTDGVLESPPEDVWKAAQAKQSLIDQAGSNPKIKAALMGVGKFAAFTAAAPLGAGAGAAALSETVIGAPIGGLVGGLIAGTLGSMGYEKLAKEIGKHDSTINSFLASQELHPGYAAAGELAGFGLGLPRAAMKAVGSLVGRGADALAEASQVSGSTADAVRASVAAGKAASKAADAAKTAYEVPANATPDILFRASSTLNAIGKAYSSSGGGLAATIENLTQLGATATAQKGAGFAATQIAKRVALSAAGMVAIDTALKEGAYQLGLSPERQTIGGAATAALLGAFAAGHGIEAKGYSHEEIGDIALRGMAHDVTGTKPGERVDYDTLASTPGVNAAAGVARMLDPLTPEESEIYEGFKQKSAQLISDGKISTDPRTWRAKAQQILFAGRKGGVRNIEISTKDGEATPTGPTTAAPAPTALPAPASAHDDAILADLKTAIGEDGAVSTKMLQDEHAHLQAQIDDPAIPLKAKIAMMVRQERIAHQLAATPTPAAQPAANTPPPASVPSTPEAGTAPAGQGTSPVAAGATPAPVAPAPVPAPPAPSSSQESKPSGDRTTLQQQRNDTAALLAKASSEGDQVAAALHKANLAKIDSQLSQPAKKEGEKQNDPNANAAPGGPVQNQGGAESAAGPKGKEKAPLPAAKGEGATVPAKEPDATGASVPAAEYASDAAGHGRGPDVAPTPRPGEPGAAAGGKEESRSVAMLDVEGADREHILSMGANIDPADLYHGEEGSDSYGEDGYGLEKEPHITALYGLHDQEPKAVQEVLQKAGPIKVKLGKISLFQNEGNPYDVVKIDVGGPAIHALNAELRKLPHTSDFPEYHPHITIAYVKKGTGEKYVGATKLTGRDITIGSATFSNAAREKTLVPLETKAEAATAPAPDQPQKSAKGLVQKILFGGKAKATLDAMGVTVREPEGVDKRGMSAEFDDKGNLFLNLDYPKLEERLANKPDREGFISAALSEEIKHLAGLVAAKEAWIQSGKRAPGPKAKAEGFETAARREGQSIFDAMDKEQRAFAADTYGDEKAEPWQVGFEFVRQLLQAEDGETPTEGFLRTGTKGAIREFIDRILAVLKRFLDNKATWSKPLQDAYDATKRVLARAERGPPAETEKTAAPAIKEGDWVTYKDDYGKTQTGKVASVWTTAAIVPTRAGIATAPRKVEYSIEDADGTPLPSPKGEVTKTDRPEQTPQELLAALKAKLRGQELAKEGVVDDRLVSQIKDLEKQLAAPAPEPSFTAKDIADASRKPATPKAPPAKAPRGPNGKNQSATLAKSSASDALKAEASAAFDGLFLPPEKAPLADYERAATALQRGTDRTQPSEPSENERAAILEAYRQIRATSDFAAVPVADVLERAGFTLATAARGKSALAGMQRTGEVIALSTGDWSLSDPRKRAWGIRTADTSTPKLMVRMDENAANGGRSLGRLSVPPDVEIRELGNATIAGPATMGIKAHHGTPHKVKKFSLDKIGTGEGAQVYGHGLYFAQAKAVAENYKNSLSKDSWLYLDGKPVDSTISEGQAISEIGRRNGDIAKTIRDLRANNKEEKAKFLEGMVKQGAEYRTSGNLYTVHIDAEPDAFLDWDKPLSEQSAKVRAALENNSIGYSARKAKGETTTGQDIYEDAANTPEGRSRRLLSAGIIGIRYLDAGSRNLKDSQWVMDKTGSGEWSVYDRVMGNQLGVFDSQEKAEAAMAAAKSAGTSNYVIFDDSKIKITHENGEPVEGGLLGMPPERPASTGSLSAPPEPQVGIPADRRAKFFALADSMEKEGITTPEKVAGFLDDISAGKARKYSQAIWNTLAAAGHVDTVKHDWEAIYSAIDKPTNRTEANSEEPHDPDANSKPPNLDAGSGAGEEIGNAGQGKPDKGLSGKSVPPEPLAGGGAEEPNSGHGELGGRGDLSGKPAGPSGGEVAGSQPGSATGDSGGSEAVGPGSGPGGIEQLDPAAQNFRFGTGDSLAPSGSAAKLRANIGAIKLLKQLEREGRNATPEEKAKLAQYTGWGQFKGAFDEARAGYRGKAYEDQAWTKNWGDAHDQIRKLLTDDEWKAAAASTLNAHYTDKPEIEAMWKMAARLGFKGGKVLESAIGIGHFYGLMPKEMADHSQLYGLDKDPISARIAQKLYPQADIRNSAFEKAKLPSNYFDLSISNFPFHEVGVGDDRYPKLNLHNYFFARNFDLVKPGGLVIAITSNSTLDANPEQRAYLQSKADLVAAIRLPNNAFKSGAGTEVTTDILIFRKPDGTPFSGESFLNTVKLGEERGKPVMANEYFQRNPYMALGKHSLQGTQYRGDSYALVADPSRPLVPALNEAIESLPSDLANHSEKFYEELAAQDHGLASGEKEGAVVLRAGTPLQVQDSKYVVPEWAKPNFRSRVRKLETRLEMAKAFVGLRDTMKGLLDQELKEDAKESEIEESRGKLRDLYAAYLKKYGNLEKGSLSFLEDDPEYYLVMGLELIGKERQGDVFVKKIGPADILSRRTLFPAVPPTKADSATDGARVSLQYRGRVDVGYVSKLTGMSEEAVERDLIGTGIVFKNPESGLLEPRDLYLASNVRKKLEAAEAAAKYDDAFKPNVEALRAIQPERVGFENIQARAGSAWIPVKVYEGFAKKILGESAKVDYAAKIDRWSASLSAEDSYLANNTSSYGTDRATGVTILSDVLNLRNPKIYDQEEYTTDAGNTAKRQVLNKEETDKAKAKADRIRKEFRDHIVSDEDARKVIEDTYNDVFNSYVVPQFDGSHVVFPGMAASYKGKPITLRPHQKDVVYRITQMGSAMMAHGVGGGKTIAQIAAAMEMKRLGLARKPLIIVDKPTIGQFAATFRQVYPNANVLVAGEDSFSAGNRKRFMARIATGNWDAVVMANSQFDKMPSDPEVLSRYVQRQVDELREYSNEIEAEEGKQSKKVRQIQTEIRRLEQRIESAISGAGSRQDDTIYFEQSGIDALFLDEAHLYKKVPFVSKMDPVKGVDKNPSKRGIMLHPKVLHIQAENRGRNVVLATGTPVTNTLAEAWTMTRLVAPQLLTEWNVDTFDKFVSAFATVESSTEINAGGQWASVERLKKFTNGPELVKMIRTAWDVRMGEDLKGLNLPEIRGGKPTLLAIETTPEISHISAFLMEAYQQFNNLTPKDRRASSWVPIVAMGTGMAAATDPRLVDTRLPDNPNSLVNTAIRKILEIHHAGTPKRSTQIVFLDRFRPRSTEKLRSFASGEMIDPETLGSLEDEKAAFNLYEDMRAKLIAGGVPKEEIAIATDITTDDKNMKVQEDMNAGRVRILIGSTAKIGQGINVQDKLVAAHHLDPPLQMTPAQYIQRNGRIIRDGNENTIVDIFTYGVKRSMAAGIWDRIQTKAKFIVQILMGKGVGRDFEDPADEVTLSIAEQVAELTGDRRILKKVELENQVRELNSAKEAHFNNLSSVRRRLAAEQIGRANLENVAIPNAEADKAWLEQQFQDGTPPVVKIEGKTVATIEEFDKALDTLRKSATDRAVAHFNENPKSYSVWSNFSMEINGFHVRGEFNTVNRDLGPDTSLRSSFSTPKTDGILSSGAETGKGLVDAAQRIFENRDQRIQSLEDKLATAKEQIRKMGEESKVTFDQQDELNSKTAEFNRLERELLGGPAGGDETADLGSLTDGSADGEKLNAPPDSETQPTGGAVEVLKAALATLPAVERKVLTMRVGGKSNEEIARATKLSQPVVETAYRVALGKMHRAREKAMSVENLRQQVNAEQAPTRTMGRPNLANPARGQASRRAVDAVDQMRKQEGIPGVRHDTDVERQAIDRISSDYDAEKAALLERGATGGLLNDVETAIAKRIVARGALNWVRQKDANATLDGVMLTDAYRVTGTETGRAMRQRRDAVLTPAQRLSEFIATQILTPDTKRQKAIDTARKNGDNEKRKEILKDWAKQIEKLKAKLKELGVDLDTMSESDMRGLAKNPVKAAKVMRTIQQAKGDTFDAVYEYWVASVLSGVGSNVANLAGNVANAAWDFSLQRMAEAAVNLLVNDPKSASFGEFSHLLAGVAPGWARAGRNMVTSWGTETPVFEEDVLGKEGTDKLELRHGAIPGKIGRFVRTPLRMLTAMDDWSKSMVGTMQVQAEAYRVATAEGLKGDAKTARIRLLAMTPTEAVNAYLAEVKDADVEDMAKSLAGDNAAAFSDRDSDAWQQARRMAALGLAEADGYTTEPWERSVEKATELAFQEDMGPIGKGINNARKEYRWLGFIFPFIKTMSNILRIGFRKTPLGSAPLLYRLLRSGAARMNWGGSDWTYSRKDFVKHAAEQLLAWGTFFALKSLTLPSDKEGVPTVTGTTPFSQQNRGKRDLAYRTAPPQSIRIGDRWYSYGRIEPFATSLAVTVDLMNAMEETGADMTKRLGDVFTHLVGQLQEKTFAKGLADVMRAIQDGDAALEWVANFATSWVPNIIRASSRETDSMVRESKIWGTGDEWMARLQERTIYKALPAATLAPSPKVDLWGNEIQKDTFGNPASDFLARVMLPVRTQQAGKIQSLDRLLLNWNNQNPNESFAPQPPAPAWVLTIGNKRRTINMTDDEYNRFLQMSGKMAAARLEVADLNVEHPHESDVKAIVAALAKSRHDARQRLWEARLNK